MGYLNDFCFLSLPYRSTKYFLIIYRKNAWIKTNNHWNVFLLCKSFNTSSSSSSPILFSRLNKQLSDHYIDRMDQEKKRCWVKAWEFHFSRYCRLTDPISHSEIIRKNMALISLITWELKLSLPQTFLDKG